MAVGQDTLGYQIKLKLTLLAVSAWAFPVLISLPRNSQVETTTWQPSSALFLFLRIFKGTLLAESSSYVLINILCQEKDNGNSSVRGRVVRRRAVDGGCLLF